VNIRKKHSLFVLLLVAVLFASGFYAGMRTEKITYKKGEGYEHVFSGETLDIAYTVKKENAQVKSIGEALVELSVQATEETLGLYGVRNNKLFQKASRALAYGLRHFSLQLIQMMKQTLDSEQEQQQFQKKPYFPRDGRKIET